MTPRRTLKDAVAALTEADQVIPETERWLDVMVVARHFKVSGESVRRWIRAGHLTAQKTPTGRYKVAASEAHRLYGIDCEFLKTSRCGIYFIQIGEFIKIGYAENVDHRVRSFVTATPHQVILRRFIECEDVRAAKKREAELHQVFASLRHKGEWFRAEDPLLEFIAS